MQHQMKITKTSPLEMQEYLCASTCASRAVNTTLEARSALGDGEGRLKSDGVMKAEVVRENRDVMRGMLRIHRFAIINWLCEQGVMIPGELCTDQMHPMVGSQTPDQKVVGPAVIIKPERCPKCGEHVGRGPETHCPKCHRLLVEEVLSP